MRTVARIRHPFIYIGVSIGLGLLISKYAVFEVTVDGLRLLGIALATVAGVLIGLVATVVTSMVRVSVMEKQFHQGVLAKEVEWLKNWCTAHQTIVSGSEDKVEDIQYLLYRHTTIPAASDEEVIEKVAETLIPLLNEWRKMTADNPDGSGFDRKATDEFQAHLEGIGATLGRIKASKGRMEVSASLGAVMWSLGFVLLLAVGIILCASIADIQQLMSANASMLALVLTVVVFIPIFFLIYIIIQYLRAETKEIKRVS